MAVRHWGWLRDRGLTEEDLAQLNPCLPGEATLRDSWYVNTATPGVIYRGTNEGTLPLVVGRWYLLPSNVVARNPDLTADSVPISRAPRLVS